MIHKLRSVHVHARKGRPDSPKACFRKTPTKCPHRRQQSPPVSLNHRYRTLSTGIGKIRNLSSKIRYRWLKRGELEPPLSKFRPPLSYFPIPVGKVRYRWFSDTGGDCCRRPQARTAGQIQCGSVGFLHGLCHDLTLCYAIVLPSGPHFG